MSRIFGIDLGTTNSLIAAMEDGAPRVIAVGANHGALLPSVVAIAPDGAITVGERAIEMEPHLNVERDGRVSAVGFAGGEYGAVIRSVKRYMGLGGDEIAPEDRARYTFADLSGPVVRFQIGKRVFTPSQISAEILRALKDGAERALSAAGKDEKVERVVITVPAYFNDGQRQATKDAGRLAGLEVVRLVNEPTAASLAYGLNKRAAGNVAVFDFGGGTFDISILSIKEGIFEVLATNGDTHLGGDDIDRVIVDWLLAELPDTLKLDRHVWNSARMAAENAKKRLTDVAETPVVVELPGHSIRKHLTRDALDQMAEPFARAHSQAMRTGRCRRQAHARRHRRCRSGRWLDADAAGPPARCRDVPQGTPVFDRSRPDRRSGSRRSGFCANGHAGRHAPARRRSPLARYRNDGWRDGTSYTSQYHYPDQRS